MIKNTDNYKNFLVKGNTLIETKYRLILKISPNDEDFKSHKIDTAKFVEFAGVKISNRYSKLRKITKRLMQRVMEIYCVKEDRTIQISWLSYAEYLHNKGVVILRFNPGLKPYLLKLKNQFTKLDIVDTLKLKSIYAVKILLIKSVL